MSLASIIWGTSTRGVKIPVSSTEITFDTLPASPVVGQTANISDSNTATWGATAAAGGSNRVLVRWNGTVWTVVGK